MSEKSPNNEIIEFKRLLDNEKKEDIANMDSDLGMGRYIKDANRMKHYLQKGRILDWGCQL